MNAFLSRDCFAGATASGTPSFLSQATFNGYIVFTNWARSRVQMLLPPELTLARNMSPTPDVHPVVFIFGDVAEGASIFAGVTIPLGVRYAEFAIAIPFVRHAASPCLHTYIPRMYADHFPASWTGNALYGFGKEMAKMSWSGSLCMLTTRDDVLLLHAAAESAGEWSDGLSGGPENFTAMRDIFGMPVVGRKADGAYVVAHFEWDFSAALVRAANASISIDAPLLDGLEPHRCHSVRSGTFQVERMIWKLSWPSQLRLRAA